jgi:hypothetical protein
MPFGPPPQTRCVNPNRTVLPAGTLLWRIHPDKYGPADFSGVLADPHFGGGRFDATPDAAYGYLYAALADHAAAAETLLRDLAFPPDRPRILPRRLLSGRRLSQVETTSDLTLLSLVTEPDLAAVRQDHWLIHSRAKDYAFTRRWAHWLREQAPWAQGMIWSTRRDLGELSMLLFRDRCPGDVLAATGVPSLALDGEAGAGRLNAMLAAYGVYVCPPRRRKCPAP